MGKDGGSSTIDPFGGEVGTASDPGMDGTADTVLKPGSRWGDSTVDKYAGGGQLNDHNFVAKQYGFDKQAWEQTNQANRPDVAGAFGGQQWTTGPDGKPTLTTSFNGPLGDAQSALQQGYVDALKQPLGGEAARQQAFDSAYGQATSRLDPQWDKREAAQRTQLLNQGLDPSSEAYKSAMADTGMQRNDAYQGAMNSAIGQSTAAGDSVFRNNLAARSSYVPQMAGMNSLLETPKFLASGQAPTAQWLQSLRDTNNVAIGQQARADQQTSDAVSGGAQVLSAAAMMACDERWKTNIHRLKAEALPGVPWATWEYKDAPGRRCFGVIAQDLEKVAPEYVHRDADGFRWVNPEFVEAIGRRHATKLADGSGVDQPHAGDGGAGRSAVRGG